MLRPRGDVECDGQVVVLRVLVNPWVGPLRLVLIAAVAAYEVGRIGAIIVKDKVADAIYEYLLGCLGDTLGTQVQHTADVEPLMHEQSRLCWRQLHGLHGGLLVVEFQYAFVHIAFHHVFQVEPHQFVVKCLHLSKLRIVVGNEHLQLVVLTVDDVQLRIVLHVERTQHVLVAGDVVEHLAVVNGDGRDVVVEHHQRAYGGQMLHRERLDGSEADVDIFQRRAVLQIQRVQHVALFLVTKYADIAHVGMV